MRFLHKNRGFTLVEMLFVVAIIALLASAVIFSVQAGKKKARDTQRVSDLSQLQIAMRLYKDFNDEYPTEDLTESELNTTLGVYLGGEARDPKTGSAGYGYVYDANSSDCGGPILYAETTETGKLGNWVTAGCAGSEPGTDTYVIKL